MFLISLAYSDKTENAQGRRNNLSTLSFNDSVGKVLITSGEGIEYFCILWKYNGIHRVVGIGWKVGGTLKFASTSKKILALFPSKAGSFVLLYPCRHITLLLLLKLHHWKMTSKK